MSRNVSFSIEPEYLIKMDKIAKAQYSDRTKLLRKWIDQNYKSEYDSDERAK